MRIHSHITRLRHFVFNEAEAQNPERYLPELERFQVMNNTTSQTKAKPAIKKIQARQWLFPLASFYAMLILPLSVLAMLGQLRWLPGLANPHVHAHELLFGIAFLVICGYLLGNITRTRLLWLTGLWLLVRISFWLLGFHPLSALFSALAAFLLAQQVVPVFWRASKWQNRSVAPIVGLISLLTAVAGSDAAVFAGLLPHALIVLSALMYFMGGRVIAPVLASFWLQHGVRMGNRVQPNVEGAGLITLGAAFALQVTTLLPALKGLVLLVAGGIIALRILRWQPWQYRSRIDILLLFTGYSGLALGVFLLGLREFVPVAQLLATHAVTVAALGVLMVTIMARVTVVKLHKDANALKSSHVASGLLVLAATTRLLAPLLPAAYMPLIHTAMLAWSLGFAVLLSVLWRCR